MPATQKIPNTSSAKPQKRLITTLSAFSPKNNFTSVVGGVNHLKGDPLKAEYIEYTACRISTIPIINTQNSLIIANYTCLMLT